MSPLAKPYATALFEVTRKQEKTSETLHVLLALVESLENHPDIFEVFKSPLVSGEDKKIFLKKAMGSAITDELENFFELLVKNNRLPELLEIVKAFETMNSKSQNVTAGVVDSAIELTDSEKKGVKQSMEKQLSGLVELQFRVRPEMIGGVEVRVGGYLFEGSIMSHIKKLNDFIIRRV